MQDVPGKSSSWVQHGCLWGSSGTLGVSFGMQTILRGGRGAYFLRKYSNFKVLASFEASWGAFEGVRGGIWGVLGRSWGSPGEVLGGLGAVLGAPWGI